MFFDLLNLSWTKFTHKKWRNFFSIFSIALGVLIILISLFATAGLSAFVKQAIASNLDGRYFAVKTPPNDKETGTPRNTPYTKDELNKIKRDNEKYGVTNIFEEKTAWGSYSFSGLKDPVIPDPTNTNYPTTEDGWNEMSASTPLDIKSTDLNFAKDYFFDKDENFADKNDGVIPVLIPLDKLFYWENKSKPVVGFDNPNPFANLGELRKNIKKGSIETRNFINDVKANPKYTQTSYDLTILNSDQKTYKPLGVKVRIVGLSKEYSSVVVPNWASQKYLKTQFSPQPEIKNDSSKNLNNFYTPISQPQTLLNIEFTSKEGRDKFVQMYFMNDLGPVGTNNGDRVYNFIQPMEDFFGILDLAKNVAIGVGIFFIVLGAIFTIININKLVTDSRKEIGLFRSLGATRMHILGIYILYSTIISSLGFVISLVLTLTINSILSLSFQEDVIYLLSAGATNRSVDKVFLLLIGNAWTETILIYFITVAVSLLAAIIPSIRATRIEPIVVLKND